MVLIAGPTTGSKPTLHIKPNRRLQGTKAAKGLNVANLKTNSAAEKLSEELESQIVDLHPGDGVEDDWALFETQFTPLLSGFLDPPQEISTTGLMRTMTP